MAVEVEVQKLRLNTFLRMLFAKNDKKVKDVAEEVKKTPVNLQNTLRHGRLNVSTLAEIMEACGEPLVLKLKTGELIQIELTDKK